MLNWTWVLQRLGQSAWPGLSESLPDDVSWLDLAVPLTVVSEGFRSRAYADREPGGIRWTVGYGATGPDIGPDTEWTKAYAKQRLAQRLAEFDEALMELTLVKLVPQQRAALVDFVYNIGIGAFRQSTLLARLNAGRYRAAARQFPRWKYDDGRVSEGLVTRRRREKSLFQTGNWR